MFPTPPTLTLALQLDAEELSITAEDNEEAACHRSEKFTASVRGQSTLTLVKSDQGELFGAYLHNKWKPTYDERADDDKHWKNTHPESFLFSLTCELEEGSDERGPLKIEIGHHVLMYGPRALCVGGFEAIYRHECSGSWAPP